MQKRNVARIAQAKKPRKPGSGRRPYQPTAEQRRRVQLLKAIGMPYRSIAAVMHIAENTMMKHFALELEFGAAEIRAHIVDLLYEGAAEGKIGAINALREMTELQPLPEMKPKVVERQTKPPKLGKKEQAKIDADGAAVGTDWAQLLQ